SRRRPLLEQLEELRLVQDGDLQLLRLLQLAARLLADHEVGEARADAGEEAAALGLHARLGLGARQLPERAGEEERLPFEAALPALDPARRDAAPRELVEERAPRVALQEADQALGGARTDAVDRAHRLDGRLAQRRERLKRRRDRLRRRLADLRDAQREEEIRERPRLARLEVGEHVGRR